MSNNIWKKTIESAKQEFSEHVYNTWIKPLSDSRLNGSCVSIQVPNNLYKDKVQRFYQAYLTDKYRALSNIQDATLNFEVSEAPKKRAPLCVAPPPSKQNTAPTQRRSLDKGGPISIPLSPALCFESFVVGANNQLAVAAAKSVAEQPGQRFNPLLVYGGVGLGKTHLLHAVGNVLTAQKGKRVIFKSSESFVNDLVQSIRFEKMDHFRQAYRQCDVLLIDDIQFFSGKERTQEEFFHTFNTLFQEKKQIVLTSDRLPGEIPDLDDRLRSRFQSGLFCDITLPDLETRLAILSHKSEAFGLRLSDEVLRFLANHITTNIRMIEGALIRLSALSSLNKNAIDMSAARSVVAALMIAQKKTSFDHILKTVARFFHLSVSDLKSSSRKKIITQPRHIAMFLARQLTEMSYPDLGSRFGGRDHTTVIHGVRKIQEDLKINDQLQNCITAIEKNLLN